MSLVSIQSFSILKSSRSAAEDHSKFVVLQKLLESESHSAFYQEGVSYTLLKVSELGLVQVAEVLLKNGADITFEGRVSHSPLFALALF